MQRGHSIILLVVAFVVVLVVQSVSQIDAQTDQPTATAAATSETTPTASAPTSTPQAATCTTLLPLVQKSLSGGCANLDRDQVCYGNNSVNASFVDTAAPAAFAQPGDIVPLSAVKTISTAPLNLERNEWGIAVIKAQANLPGTTGGQAVNFLLYGDTTITKADTTTPATAATEAATPTQTAPCSATINRVTYLRATPEAAGTQVQLLKPGTGLNVHGRTAASDWILVDVQGTSGWVFTQTVTLSCDVTVAPVIDTATGSPVTPPGTLPLMQAFYFTTNIAAQAACKDIPASGLVIQNPSGQRVKFNANGADITIASTVLLRATAGKSMTVSLLEGHATIGVGNILRDLIGGQELTIPLGGANGLQASGPPTIPQPSQSGNFALPTLCQVGQAAGITLPCKPTPVCTFNVAKFVAGSNPASLVVNVTGAPSCAATKMYWTVSGVDSVYFNGIKVPLDASYGVCINKATTYELKMVCGAATKSVFYTLQYQPITNNGQ